MERIGFQFSNVLVVADEEDNIFSHQLRERDISFTWCKENRAKLTSGQPPDLILVVNKDLERVVVPLKAQYPKAQVISCHGGKKAFAPQLLVVWSKKKYNYDVHFFRDWDDFIRLIGQKLMPKTKSFCFSKPMGGGKWHCFSRDVMEAEPADTKSKLADMYASMLKISRHYLLWLEQWLEKLAGMEFTCDFQVKGRRTRVTVPFGPGELEFWGKPVFSEEDRVVFTDLKFNKYYGTVTRVGDEELEITFSKPLKKQIINGLQKFSKQVSKRLVRAYIDFFETKLGHETGSLPLHVISGKKLNRYGNSIDTAVLTSPQAHRLFHDESQWSTLADMTSSRPISVVVGGGGTGKTFTTSLAALQFHRLGNVVLVVSHSNQGLDNLLSQIVGSGVDPEAIFRLGNNVSNITPVGLPFHRSVRFSNLALDQQTDFDEICSGLEVEEIKKRPEEGKSVFLGITLNSFLVERTLCELIDLRIEFQIALIDEASRGLLYELLPIVMATTERVIFVGDPEQLGNIEISRYVKDYLVGECDCTPDEVELFAKGWFNCLVEKELLPVSWLIVNRRSLQRIAEFISYIFYSGKMISGRFDPNNPGQILFYDTCTANGKRQKKVGTSFANGREATKTVSFIVWHLANGGKLEQIVVITPYRGHIKWVIQKLRQALLFNARLQDWRKEQGLSTDPDEAEATNAKLAAILRPLVGTVDAYQGSEREVVCLNFVRSNVDHVEEVGDIGFNRNLNRIRVACTRARDSLVIVADSATFLQCEHPHIVKVFAQMIEFIKKYGGYKKLK